MLNAILLGVGAFVAIWLLLSLSGSVPALLAWKAQLVPLDDQTAHDCLERVLTSGTVAASWADEVGFEPTGTFSLSTLPNLVKIVAWTNAREASYLCVYLYGDQRIEIDLVSISGDKGLTTGTTKDGQLLPTRPGSYRQTFSAHDAAELWNRHQEAAQFLYQLEGFRPDPTAPSFIDRFAEAMRREGTYIRSLWLWPLRTPYWYFVRRSVLHDKSIQTQLAGRAEG